MRWDAACFVFHDEHARPTCLTIGALSPKSARPAWTRMCRSTVETPVAGHFILGSKKKLFDQGATEA